MKAGTAVLLTLVLLLVAPLAHADAVANPSMTFYFGYKTSEPITISNGRLVAADGGDSGVEFFNCISDSCEAVFSWDNRNALNPKKLIMNFSDRMRESNVFSPTMRLSEFGVEVTDSGLLVTEKSSMTVELIKSKSAVVFILALFIDIIIEIGATLALIYAKFIKPKNPFRFIASFVGINLVTLPIVWFLVPSILATFSLVAVLEFIVIAFEAVCLFYLNRDGITLQKAVVVSFIANLLSFFLGGYLITFFQFFVIDAFWKFWFGISI